MMKVKYIKTSLITLAFILSLTACGGEEKAPEATSQKSSYSETSQEETDGTSDKTHNEVSGSEQTTENNSSEATTSETASGEISSEESATKVTSEDTVKGETTTKKPSSSSKEETTTKKPTQNTGTQSELSTLVKKTLNGIITSGMSELEKVLVIHDYITYNIDYDYDNYLNNTIPNSSCTAYGALTTGRAVCSGYAYAFYEMAKATGLEVEIIVGEANNGNGWGSHAWNQVKISGVWYNIDTCWDDPTMVGKVSNDHSMNGYAYCLISDSTMYKDHKAYAGDNVHTCTKNYDTATLGKALAKVNKFSAMVYAGNAGEIEAAVKQMATAGKNTYSILMPSTAGDCWDEIYLALAKTKKPLWVQSTSQSQSMWVYRVEVKENVCCVDNAADLKKAIANYSGKLDKLVLWYYDDTMTENTASSIINEALYKTGYNVEVSSRTEVCGGKSECYLKELTNVLRVDDLADVVAYMKSNGMTTLMSKYIWYATTDTNSANFENKLREAFISSGYLLGYSSSLNSYSSVIKFEITEATQIKYISSATDLISYVNSIGLANLVGKDFFIKNNSQNGDISKYVDDLFYAGQYPVRYTLNDLGSVVGVSVYEVISNTYISVDEADLKADITDAKNKGTVSNVEFRLIDRSGAYDEESIRAMIAAMGCGVVLDSHWYSEGNYHMVRVRVV